MAEEKKSRKKRSVLKLKNVSKKLGGKQIISNLSFSVKEGEIFGFLGPNGAGKTTTIKMIVGLLKIDRGEIFINGYSIKKNQEKALKSVGGIIENPEMYDYLSGMQNLKIYGRMHTRISKERYEQIIEKVGLSNRINEKVKKYSLGMRQRLGIAQALIHRPKLLILDEPTNGLDPAGIRQLRNYLRELAASENMAILVSSHLLSEMELMCDRFGIVDKGTLVDIKSLSEIRTSGSDESLSYHLVTDNGEKAMATVLAFDDQAKIEKDIIEFCANAEEVAAINASLVGSGIKVYELAKAQRTLEDEFIDITTGENGSGQIA